MKTAIQLSPGKTLDLQPCTKQGGMVATLAFQMFGMTTSEAMHLTPETCWRMIVRLEQAFPENQRLHTKQMQFEASAG